MKVSAVGFLFQNKVKTKGLKGNNYTCIVHKRTPNGNYTRNVVRSPLIKENTLNLISPKNARTEIIDQLNSITENKKDNKFIGATIKDGVKETEIHSIFADRLFAIRTKDDLGKNHIRISGRKNTQKILSHNLNLSC